MEVDYSKNSCGLRLPPYAVRFRHRPRMARDREGNKSLLRAFGGWVSIARAFIPWWLGPRPAIRLYQSQSSPWPIAYSSHNLHNRYSQMRNTEYRIFRMD